VLVYAIIVDQVEQILIVGVRGQLPIILEKCDLYVCYVTEVRYVEPDIDTFVVVT
jgi:hypothetical protein